MPKYLKPQITEVKYFKTEFYYNNVTWTKNLLDFHNGKTLA